VNATDFDIEYLPAAQMGELAFVAALTPHQ